MDIIILILGLLSAFGPLSIDMYLPSLPTIAKDFAVPLASVQLSLSSFLIGIAAGQVFYGPITDRWGRKRPLYVGLGIYALASFACAVTDSVHGLILFRFMQAIGACAGMVIGRAIVRDLYQPHESARVYSLLMLIMGVAPILAPMLGGFMAIAWGWRSIFWILTGVSTVTLITVHFYLRETQVAPVRHGLKEIVHTYIHIFKDWEFTGYVLASSLVYAGLFAYITSSPFVFIDHYGLAAGQYAWVFGSNAFGLIAFSQINGRLLRNRTPQQLLRFIFPCMTFFGFLVLSVGLVDGPMWAMCVTLFFFILTLGMIAPNSTACALSKQGKYAGSASALMGTIQFTVAGLSSSLVSHFHNGTIRPMTFTICLCGSLAMIVMKFADKTATTV